MKIESNPAFPLAFDYATLKRLDSEAKETGETLFVGDLSKREYFAGLAMQGMLSNSFLCELLQKIKDPDKQMEFLNTAAIEQADDIMKRLENTSQVD